MSSNAPGPIRSMPPTEAPKESAVTRLLIAPLTFVTFLISLALIDSQNHQLRTHSHSPSRAPPTTTLGRLKALLHTLIFKPLPGSPYAYVKSPNPSTRSRSGTRDSGNGSEATEKEPWHWHTKQRHLMKAEMEDAFKLRQWVIIVIMGLGLGLAVGGAVFVRWCLWIWRGWGSGEGLAEI